MFLCPSRSTSDSSQPAGARAIVVLRPVIALLQIPVRPSLAIPREPSTTVVRAVERRRPSNLGRRNARPTRDADAHEDSLTNHVSYSAINVSPTPIDALSAVLLPARPQTAGSRKSRSSASPENAPNAAAVRRLPGTVDSSFVHGRAGSRPITPIVAIRETGNGCRAPPSTCTRPRRITKLTRSSIHAYQKRGTCCLTFRSSEGATLRPDVSQPSARRSDRDGWHAVPERAPQAPRRGAATP